MSNKVYTCKSSFKWWHIKSKNIEQNYFNTTCHIEW